jgi:hypothetical protein
MRNKFYVYVHKRLDNDQIFYVGKGSNRRYKEYHNRNQKWKNYTNKYKFTSEILYYFETEDEAYKREQALISTLQLLNYDLCNLCSGGLGGTTHSIDTKNKISNTLQGHLVSKETKNKISNSLKSKFLGSENNNYKGIIEATDIITNKKFLFSGRKELIDFGFNHICVYNCLAGRQKTHKNFIFQRT